MELKGLVLIRNLHRGERTIWLVSKNWLLSVSKDLVLSVVKRASFDEPVQKVKVLYLFSKYSFVGLLCMDLFGKGSQSGEWDVNIYILYIRSGSEVEKLFKNPFYSDSL